MRKPMIAALVLVCLVAACAVAGSKDTHDQFGCWPAKEAEQCRWLTSDCQTIKAFTVHVKEGKWFVDAPSEAAYIYCVDVSGKRVEPGECAGVDFLPKNKGECFRNR